MVEILKMKFDQDLCKNSRNHLKSYFELNPWLRCAFGNVYVVHPITTQCHLESIKGQLQLVSLGQTAPRRRFENSYRADIFNLGSVQATRCAQESVCFRSNLSEEGKEV